MIERTGKVNVKAAVLGAFAMLSMPLVALLMVPHMDHYFTDVSDAQLDQSAETRHSPCNHSSKPYKSLISPS